MSYLDEILGYQQQGQISGRGKLRPDQVEAAFRGYIGAEEQAATTSRSQALQERQVATGEKAQAAQESESAASLAAQQSQFTSSQAQQASQFGQSQAQQSSQFQQNIAQTQSTQQGQQKGQETQSLIAAGGVLAGIFNAWNKPADKTADSFDKHYTQIDKQLGDLKEKLSGQESALAKILNKDNTGGALGSDAVIQTSKAIAPQEPLAPFTEKAPVFSVPASPAPWGDYLKSRQQGLNFEDFSKAYPSIQQDYKNIQAAYWTTYNEDIDKYNKELGIYDQDLAAYQEKANAYDTSGYADYQPFQVSPELSPAYQGGESGGDSGGGYSGNEGSGSSGGE